MKIPTILLIWMIAAGCALANGEKPADTQKATVAFSGQVVYNDFEGGFYGVLTDDNRRLIGDIPDALKKDKLRVEGIYREKEPQMSFRMWGNPVEFFQIHRADP